MVLNCLMLNAAPFDDAIREIEILQATLAVKDHFLSSIVKDIYEHTGQQLGAVRVQLALLESKSPAGLTALVREAGQLVGQTMADLKSMSRNFFPERLLDSAPVFIHSVKEEISKFNAGSETPEIKISGNPFDLKRVAAVVLFAALLKILALLQSHTVDMTQFEIVYTKKRVQLKFVYEGNALTDKEVAFINSRFLGVTNNHKTQSVEHCIILSFENAAMDSKI